MIVNSCLLVLYVRAAGGLFVGIFLFVVMSSGSGGGGGEDSFLLMFGHPAPPLPHSGSPTHPSSTSTDSNQQVHKPHLTANLAH